MNYYRLLLLLFCLRSLDVAADAALWRALQTEPNMVVVMRHGHAQGGDPLKWDESGNCRGERLLSDDGKALARVLGKYFKDQKITPTTISSPMCRCKQTAEIAFGAYITEPALREIASADETQTRVFHKRTRELLTKYRGAKPIVFISHRPNVDALTMELISIGDLLIGRIDDSGGIDILGKMRITP